MAAIELIHYREEHREAVLRLQQHLWSTDPVLNQAYFSWKYEQNPYLPIPRIVLATCQGTVVGMRGLIGARWRLGSSGRWLDAPFADDLVVAPDFRRQGISSRLIQANCLLARELGFPFVLSLRGGPHTLLDSLAVGFRSMGAMEPVGWTPSTVKLIEAARTRLRGMRGIWRLADSQRLAPARDRQPFQGIDRLWGRRAPGGTGIQASSRPQPGAMADLTDRLPEDGRCRQVRDLQFLEWVLRNPRLEYRVLLQWENDRVTGYLVLHRVVTERGSPLTVWISDWEGTSSEVRRALLAAVLRAGGFSRLGVWTATLPDADRMILAEAGFEPIDLQARARGRPAALIWVAEPEASGPGAGLPVNLMELSHWKLRMLDQS